MVGVLICTYNGEKYITEQLESLLSQLKQPDEVIIVDDCSTDNTTNICKLFIDKHRLNNKWKVIINDTNQGWKSNFFKGVDYFKSEYIFFCDQDDIWDSHKILDLYNLMLNNPTINVSACFESLYIGDSIKKCKTNNYKKFYFSSDMPIKMLFHNFSGSCMCIKKEFYMKIKQYWNNQWAHDNFFWWIAYASDSICILNKSLVLHRITGENASRNHMSRNDRINYCQNILKNIKVIENILSKYSGAEINKKIFNFAKIKKGIILRQKFLSSMFLSPFYGIILLIKYRFVYLKIRTFFGDCKSILLS